MLCREIIRKIKKAENMFGRFGWAEILVVVVLVLILFGHNKIPGMMKNLADGLNVFKKELKDAKDKNTDSHQQNQSDDIVGQAAVAPMHTATSKKASAQKSEVKKPEAKKSVASRTPAKKVATKAATTKKPVKKTVVKDTNKGGVKKSAKTATKKSAKK